MSWARVMSTSAATVAVAGCVALAVGMSRADTPVSAPAPAVATTHAPLPTTKTFAGQAARPAAGTSVAAARTARPSPARSPSRSVTATSAAAPAVRTSAQPAGRPAAGPAAASTTSAAPVAPPAPIAPVAPVRHVAAVTPKGAALPLHYGTGSATRVVTVTAHSTRSTTATVQAWTKASGGGWKRVGSSIAAHIGSDGMSTHASESRSATPMGSFTLTQAFGRNSDPGTSLPYLKTNPSDYWISDEGSRYNTHQRCGSCGYNDGVNERLYYVTPEYDYAVVIDYNTRNAPGGVHAGRGSAFFLHVTDGSATAGCVAIPKSRLIPLMRWLTPGTHPRILIGTA